MKNIESYEFNYYPITIAVQSISPSDAKVILDETNHSNRNPSKPRISRYIRDMKNGNWKFNGDPIRFDENGILLDGQHRLIATIEAGVTVDFLVVKGIKSSAKSTIDTGKARTGGDALAIEFGVKTRIASVINGALRVYSKYLKNNLSYGGGNTLTNDETLALYEKNKEEIESALLFMEENIPVKGCIMSQSNILFLMLVLSNLDENLAREFMVKVIKGVGVESGSVEMFLREIIIESRMRTRKLTDKQIVLSTIKCWNSIRRGSPIKHKGNCIHYPSRDGNLLLAK